MSHGAQGDCKINAAEMLRAFHPHNSLDLSPYDFWAFEMLKQKMMNRHLQSAEAIPEMMQAKRVK
jgi:hypothetical protein